MLSAPEMLRGYFGQDREVKKATIGRVMQQLVEESRIMPHSKFSPLTLSDFEIAEAIKKVVVTNDPNLLVKGTVEEKWRRWAVRVKTIIPGYRFYFNNGYHYIFWRLRSERILLHELRHVADSIVYGEAYRKENTTENYRLALIGLALCGFGLMFHGLDQTEWSLGTGFFGVSLLTIAWIKTNFNENEQRAWRR